MVVFVGIYSEAPVNEIAIYDSETNHVETRTLCQSIPYVVNGLNAEFGNELKQISVIFADNERRISEEIKKIPKVHVIQKEKSCFNGYSSAILDMGAQILEFTMNAGLINCFLYIISSSHSGIKGVKPVKTYETYCADDGLKTIADHVFGLKEGEAHLVFQFSDISQTEKESMIQKIEQDKEYFASTTMNQEELDTKDHYKAMIYSRFLSGDEQVKTLIKTDPNYFVDNAYDKGVNKLNTDRNERSKYKSRIITRPQFIDSYGSQTKLMGIDLGATRSVVCVSRNGSTELVKIDQENAMPTYISFAEDEPIVGSVAMRKLNYEPKSVLFDIKRTTDLSPRQFEKCWPFGICKTSETISFVVHSKTEIKEHSLVDVYKILVQKLKAKASEFQFDLNQGEPVNQAVFTVPFLDEGPAGHGMVSSIIKAANECGIKVIDIIEGKDLEQG
uniref:Uncharacterized protein n=1 Tax=Panagrolaimus sp. JU765 TaxID=591449 RepID=A0AC34QB93_9BILA